ncbi:hypothetical protein SDC9_165717 [bioreactor metagenome]|uniref:Uncharacterized protein n=1 Tax=bioreactor metagenome TaxID=1076179 RepID=A0A645FV84_9ZZZZ
MIPEPSVEHVGEHIQLLIADVFGNLDDRVLQHARVGHDDEERAARGYRHQLDMADLYIRKLRSHDHRRIVRQLREHLGRFCDDALHIQHSTGKIAAHERNLALGQARFAHHRIHIQAIRPEGGNAARRRMRLFQKSQFLEIGHLVSNRRRAQSKIMLFRKRARGDGYGGLNIIVDDRLEQLCFSVV